MDVCVIVVGVLKMEFTLHGNNSLKGKRNVSMGLKRKMRNKFNLAVAEVDSLDSHTRLVLAAVTVGNDWVNVESRLNKAMLMAEALAGEEMTDSDIELFTAD